MSTWMCCSSSAFLKTMQLFCDLNQVDIDQDGSLLQTQSPS